MTVWSPAGLHPLEWHYRWSRRLFLPLFYIGCVVVGVLAVTGSTAMSEIFDRWIVAAVSFVFILAAVVSLAATIIPKAWRVEIIATIVLFGLLAGYAASVWVTSIYRGPLPAVAATLLLLVPLMRLSALGELIKEHRR